MKVQIFENVGTFEVPFVKFSFPDGQQHVELDRVVCSQKVRIIASIRSAADLMDVLLMNDVLRRSNNEVHLVIQYLLGARMDRPINDRQPFTLKVVANMLNAGRFETVQILDAHSAQATSLIQRAYNRLPMEAVTELLQRYDPNHTVVVIPDKGAISRVEQLLIETGKDQWFDAVQCAKHRDPQTGRLSSFTVDSPSLVKYQHCVIIDDICDGGATFTGLAKELFVEGASGVDLFVTHGIFSKGLPLKGITEVFTTTDDWPPRLMKASTRGAEPESPAQ